MKNIVLYISLLFIISACSSEQQFIQPFEREHFELDAILDHLPFDQFNENSKAIFRDSNGKLIEFRLTIDEKINEFFDGDNFSSSNEITFRYRSDFSFEIPDMEVVARIEILPDLGARELLICNSVDGLSSFFTDAKLKIIPGQSYENTILNEEFTWLDETFENVYVNILIEENNSDKVKIFYQSEIGIIGFKDKLNKAWVFDHYE